jgi:hypothetical protein
MLRVMYFFLVDQRQFFKSKFICLLTNTTEIFMGDADLEGNVAFVGGTDSYSHDNDDSVVDEGSKSEGKRGVKRKLEDNENEDAELTEEDIGE